MVERQEVRTLKAVEVENLVKEFPADEFFIRTKRILDNISFSVEEGHNLAIIGPNGSGKTTLLKTVSTIYKPNKGTVKIFGHDAFKEPEKVRDYFSFVSPGLNFQNKLTLKQTMKFFAAVMGRKTEDIIPFFEKMDIMHMWEVRLEGFSEGQKAMVRLATGLMKDPRILMLDEVVATLDIEHREGVLDFISALDKERNFTIIMVDHDPRVVDRLCNKILILDNKGRVYKYTTVEELTDSLSHEFSINVTFKRPTTEEDAKALGLKVKLYNSYSARFFAEDEDEVHELSHNLMKKKDLVAEFSTSPVSLKDVYFLMMDGEI